MEKRIELERRGKSPSEIVSLSLDNCKSASVIGLNDQYKSLEELSLSNVGLTSLKDFPKLPALKSLELSDNCISGGLHHLNVLPSLTNLNLSNNKISSIENLSPLKEIKTLISLDLINCDVSNEDKYRDKIFEMLPDLVYLDGFDREDNEIEDEGVLINGVAHPNGVKVVNGVNDVDDEDLEEEEEEEDDDEDEQRISARGKTGGGHDQEQESDIEEEEEDYSDMEEELSDEEVPLRALYDTYDESKDKDYEAGAEPSDEDIEEEDEESQAEHRPGRGKKRKFEDAKE